VEDLERIVELNNPNHVTLTSVYSNSFIDGLISLSQIKKDLAIPNLEFNFLKL
jgi:hypothetical protein